MTVDVWDVYPPSAQVEIARTFGSLNGFVRQPETTMFVVSIALASGENPVVTMTGSRFFIRIRMASLVTDIPLRPGIVPPCPLRRVQGVQESIC